MKTKILFLAALLMLSSVAFADFDLGDLPECNYPTFFGNPSHTTSQKAWLGQFVDDEDEPLYGDLDAFDDGVAYLGGLQWTPCTPVSVQVTITLGPEYDDDPLFLNGWKDGNFDGDFCDELCASEWIVQDMPVTAGTYTISFIDPGVFDIGFYPGVFRWRLTGRLIGRNGFGQYNPFDCDPQIVCGNFLSDSLGEVEDYWIPDLQLDVTLNGFDAIPRDGEVLLTWTTASEFGNDHFEILRSDEMLASVPAQGDGATGFTYSWTDRGLINGTTYTYSLASVDVNGNREELASESATPSAEALVTEYALHQNYPNPFNPSTSISIDLVESGSVMLTVYNVIGQEVAELVNGNLASGRHTINFDAANLPSALYIYRLEANGFTDQKKMLLIK